VQAGISSAHKKYRIAIDAGHGGKDNGAQGVHKTLEKNINLRAAIELAKLLKDSGNFDVLLTRQDDTFIPLSQRSKEANNFHADMFVSLHCNAASNRSEGGFEIYFLSEKASDPESQRVADVENAVLTLENKSPEQEAAASLLQAMAKTEFINDSSELAGLMAKELSRHVDIGDRGVKQAAFYVLRGTETPAVLVEMGFLSRPEDEVRLASKGFRRKLLEGLYAGILDFARRHQWHLEN
jgi:N-acetylmuramoyl-L-alanine amidase